MWQGKPYIVVDTGGITGEEEGLDMIMAGQSLQAIEEADAVLFLVDSRAGRTAGDELIAAHLRKRNKHTYLIANKIDGADPDSILGEFSKLGLGAPIGIAASLGRNINPMLDAVLNDENWDKVATDENGVPLIVEAIGTKIAVIGRPNVGKSTLVNRMLGEDRVVVFDQAGTTRDSIYIPYERYEKPYTLIDTAGVRRRGKVYEAIEKFSVIKTLQAIQDANVVIFVVDARDGIVEQDLHLLGFVLEAGRALVIAVNKWDGMENEEKEFVKTELQRRLIFAQFADLHFISALHGSGVGLLYKSVDKAFESAMTKVPTRRMTEILEDAVTEHQPPMSRGRRIKLRYAHLGGSNPPIIIVHGNQVDAVPRSYTRYLENTYRKVLKLAGTPIRVEYKSGENPYADLKNKLTDRQVNKKRRLMSHNKKAKKKSKDRR